jgi:MFS family permease
MSRSLDLDSRLRGNDNFFLVRARNGIASRIQPLCGSGRFCRGGSIGTPSKMNQESESPNDSLPSSALQKPSRRERTFVALKYPNYRLWFQGQVVSLLGTWMQTTAQGYLIYELTRSPAYLGYVGFAAGVPTWLLTLYGGVIADRVSRRTLMIVTQSAMMVFAFILAALTFLHIVQPWHVLVLSFLLGVANSFDAPARQAFVGEMVDQEDLTNAIALNATMFHTATAIGPAVAGITYALFGPGWCFTINGISFIAVIVALRMMKLKTHVRPLRVASAFSEFKEGVLYVAGHKVVRVMIGIIAVNSMFTLSLTTLVPAWSVAILGGDATTNGFLYSARGLGSLIGALTIATLGRIAYRGKLVTIGSFIAPVLLMAFSALHWLPASLVILGGVGVGTILIMNLANAIVQTSTPESLRGRVMGAYTWIFFGFMPVGSLWTGEMASRVGLSEAVLINGSLALTAALVVWVFFPHIRRQ